VKQATSTRALGTARVVESVKRRKYLKMKTRHQMELIPFVVETYGGVGPAAVKLLKAMAAAGEEHLAMWPKKNIIRHVLESVAIAVQRGTAMAYLEGYDRALTALGESSTEEDEEAEGHDENEEAEGEEEEDGDEVGRSEESEEGDGERLWE
jgi:hypothetical protein